MPDTTIFPLPTGIHPASPEGLPIGPAHPWLAPLAGYSDLPFRLLCREFGASVACTEMVSAKGLIFGQSKKSNATNGLLLTYPPLEPVLPDYGKATIEYERIFAQQQPDSPLVVQLFGAEASFMGEAVSSLSACGYRWFDCNMGCSVPKVSKSGAGSAMLDNLENCIAVAEAMIKAAGRGTVGFKLRLGREAGAEVYLELGKALEKAGAGWLTIHPRYARQKFSGTADWQAVIPLVQAVSIPVILSGDLFSAADGIRALGETGVAGLMFARGAMHNPSIFRQLQDMLAAVAQPARLDSMQGRFVDAAALEQLIRRHAELIRLFYPVRHNKHGLEAGLLKMRTFVPRYVKDCSGARALRRSMTACESWQALDALLDDFFGREENLLRAETPALIDEDLG